MSEDSMSDFPGKGQVAVIKTSPETVLDDYQQLLKMAGMEKVLPKGIQTGLKINISWQTWYPACSTAPWQLEGVIKYLQSNGFQDLVGVHNDTVVVDTSDGEANNKHKAVTDQYNVPCLYLYNQDFEWIEFYPKNHEYLHLSSQNKRLTKCCQFSINCHHAFLFQIYVHHIRVSVANSAKWQRSCH